MQRINLTIRANSLIGTSINEKYRIYGNAANQVLRSESDDDAKYLKYFDIYKAFRKKLASLKQNLSQSIHITDFMRVRYFVPFFA